MKQEDKELLLKDICARLPYGVKCVFRSTQGDIPSTVVRIDKEAEMVIHRPDGQKIEYFYFIEDGMFKPYLRPMSSMTEEEQKEFGRNCGLWKREEDGGIHFINRLPNLPNEFADILISEIIMARAIDWLNAHYFDYRGLIEKGLALEAPEGMY